MRLRPIPEITDRHQLKPAIGDVVSYEGVAYIVTQVGNRYVYMYRRDDPSQFNHIAKVTLVMKTGENIFKAKNAPKAKNTP